MTIFHFLRRIFARRTSPRRNRFASLAVEPLELRYCLTGAGEEFFFVPGEIGQAQQAVLDWNSRSAGYNNEVFVFKVDDAEGTIDGIAPGTAGYMAEVLSRAQVAFPSGERPGALKVFDVLGGEWYAVGFVQNATVAKASSQNPNGLLNKSPKTFVSPTAANADGFDHFRVSQSGTDSYRISVEDLTGGGDQDFNDIVFTLAFTEPTPEGDLDIILPSGDSLDDEKEDKGQGFVIARNSDDDNANGKPDLTETGAVAGENDLWIIELKAQPQAPAGSEFSLEFATTYLKIWKSADRTGAVQSGTNRFDASQTTRVYVEGHKVTEQAGGGTVTMKLHRPNVADAAVLDRVRFTVVELDLLSITFSAVVADQFHAVTKDNGEPYPERQYQNLNPGDAQDSANIKAAPIAFTRGATVRADTEVKMRSTVQGIDGSAMRLRGQGFRSDEVGNRVAYGAFDFEAEAKFYNTKQYINFSEEPQKAKVELDDVVDAIKPLTIEWTVSFDGGTTWLPAGTSSNAVYATYAKPTFREHNDKLYHSILDLGAVHVKGLGGAETPTQQIAEQAAEMLWKAFKDRDVKRVDGTSLKYYGTWSFTENAGNAVELIKMAKPSGDCDAFASLFQYALDDLGFSAFAERVSIVPNSEDWTRRDPAKPENVIFVPTLLLIGGFTFEKKAGPLLVERLPGLFINTSVGPFFDEAEQKYLWTEEDVKLILPVIPGQGKTTPWSHFTAHSVVQVGDVVYDPSYGDTATATGGFRITNAALGFDQYLIQFHNTAVAGLAQVRLIGNPATKYSWDIVQKSTINIANPPANLAAALMVTKS